MQTKLLLFLCFVLSFVSQAQSKLTGTILDANYQPIDFAEILLLDQEEKLLQQTSTDDKGIFTFAPVVSNATYRIQVVRAGAIQYKAEFPLQGDHTLDPIIIQADQVLDEIVVATQPKLFQQKIDRTVFNIAQSVHANNSNAKDLLRLTPGLKVDKDQISLVGKSSMQVMINDKLLPLTGEELINYLQTIPSETIQKIEVITTPPAKYEASGNSGLIHIVLKQTQQDSWNNQLSTGVHTADKANWKISDIFHYSKDKVSFAASIHASTGYAQEIGRMELYYPTETWKTLYRETQKNKDFSGTLQLDYQATPKTAFGIQYRGNKNAKKTSDKNATNVYNLVDNLLKQIQTTGKSTPDFNNHSLNLNAIHSFDTLGTKVSLDLDYFNYNTQKNRVFNTKITPVDNFVNKEAFSQTDGDQKIDNYSAKLDVEQPFTKVKLSYGAKVSFVQTVNNANSAHYNLTTNTSDILQADHFVYKENIQAAYISASTSLSSQWEAQLGLRVESTQTLGESVANQSKKKTNYTELFPTLYVNYQVNEDQTVSLTANRRISRPSFWQLNPFRWYVNEYNYVTGNPDISPTFVNALTLNYTLKSRLFIQTSYSKVTQLASQYSTIDTANTIQILQHDNIFDGENYNLSITHIFDRWSWLTTQNTVSLFYNTTKLLKPVNLETNNGSGYYFSTNNSLQLNTARTLQAQVDFWYQSQMNNGNWKLQSMYALNLGMKYALLDKKLNLSAYVNDVFRTSHLQAEATSDGVKQGYNMYHDNRYFTLGLSYSFGNSKIQVKERQGSNKDVINRK